VSVPGGGACVVLVDGENTRRSVWPNIGPRKLVERCRRWAEEHDVRVVVAFDGDAPSVEPDDRVVALGSGDRSADDVIAGEAERLRAAGERFWVVTSDRELRARASPGAERVIGGGSFARELARSA
jgi:hypothetical protein